MRLLCTILSAMVRRIRVMGSTSSPSLTGLDGAAVAGNTPLIIAASRPEPPARRCAAGDGPLHILLAHPASVLRSLDGGRIDAAFRREAPDRRAVKVGRSLAGVAPGHAPVAVRHLESRRPLRLLSACRGGRSHERSGIAPRQLFVLPHG